MQNYIFFYIYFLHTIKIKSSTVMFVHIYIYTQISKQNNCYTWSWSCVTIILFKLYMTVIYNFKQLYGNLNYTYT